jgi:ABC-2 type transport system permease protein
MSANIYKHEFHTRLRSVIVWSLSVAALILFFFSLFPVFSDQAAEMNRFLAKYPPQLSAAFGLNRMDLSTVLGFYGFILMFIQLCMAIQAGNYGFGLVSVEENEMTADFLLSKPVSRVQILTSKLLAALTSLLLTDVVVWVASFTAILAFHGEHEYEIAPLLLLFLSLLIFQLFFLAVGLVISLLVKRIRSVTPWGLGLAFGAYILNAFSGIFGDIKLEYITPFKHLDPSYIIKNATYNIPLVVLNVAVTLVSLAVTYWLYTRRDIPAVS